MHRKPRQMHFIRRITTEINSQTTARRAHNIVYDMYNIMYIIIVLLPVHHDQSYTRTSNTPIPMFTCSVYISIAQNTIRVRNIIFLRVEYFALLAFTDTVVYILCTYTQYTYLGAVYIIYIIGIAKRILNVHASYILFNIIHIYYTILSGSRFKFCIDRPQFPTEN